MEERDNKIYKILKYGKFHINDFKDISRDDLINFVVKKYILPESNRRFNLYTIDDGLGNIYTAYKQFEKRSYKWAILERVHNYGSGYEQYQRLSDSINRYTLARNLDLVTILREQSDYNEYLKQFGL